MLLVKRVRIGILPLGPVLEAATDGDLTEIKKCAAKKVRL